MVFQLTTPVTQAPAQAGDFASRTSMKHSALVTETGYFAGASGLLIGAFCWADATGKNLNNFGSGAPLGFVHREEQALLTAYLQQAGYTVPAGFGAP